MVLFISPNNTQQSLVEVEVEEEVKEEVEGRRRRRRRWRWRYKCAQIQLLQIVTMLHYSLVKGKKDRMKHRAQHSNHRPSTEYNWNCVGPRVRGR